MSTFHAVLTEAVADMRAHGYDSAERVAYWLDRIRAAAEESLIPPEELARALREKMGATYAQMVDKDGIARAQGVMRWQVEKVRPQLRAELDRRILASADLIKRNREEAVAKTLQRFSGWATAQPIGGSRVSDVKAKDGIRKALAQLPFEERRVIIDQNAKLVSTLNEIVAVDNGAIAAVWHSRWRTPGYNYRDPHKERDGRTYAIRGNWALERGLMKPGPNGYTDQITQPAEEPFCRCSYSYVYALRDLPEDMVTAKGRAEMLRVREAIAANQ